MSLRSCKVFIENWHICIFEDYIIIYKFYFPGLNFAEKNIFNQNLDVFLKQKYSLVALVLLTLQCKIIEKS